MNWKYNNEKALGLLTREYGISSKQALTEYTEDQIQLLLSQLPTERVVQIQQGMSKIELENKYLLQFMDRDIEKVVNSQELTELRDRRANLKAQLRKDTENETLKQEIAELTKQINGA